MSDLFPSEGLRDGGPQVFVIADVDGSEVARHHRRDRGDGTKIIWWTRRGSKGLRGIKVRDLPLYGCHRLSGNPDDAVVLTEGEKATDALRRRGLLAVGTVTGAKGCPSAEVLQVLAGRDVVLWPDNDDEGRLHMERIAQQLRGVAKSVRWFEWSDAPPKGDAADWEGGTSELRRSLGDAVPPPPGSAPDTTTEDEAPGALEFVDPEPWPEPVDGAALLDRIERQFSRFVVLPKKVAAALALWVVHTYAIDTAEFSPRLCIISATKACGKTRLLTVLGILVCRALDAAGLTAAVAYRCIEKFQPTVLLDEADTLSDDASEALRAVLNAGFQRGRAMYRCAASTHEPQAFNVFGAFAVARIGRLPTTVEDRGIIIEMRPRARGEHVDRLRQGRQRRESLPLRRQCVPMGLGTWRTRLSMPIRLFLLGWTTEQPTCGSRCSRLQTRSAATGRPVRVRRRRACQRRATDPRGTLGSSCSPTVEPSSTPRARTGSLSKYLMDQLVSLDERPWGEWGRAERPITQRGVAGLLRPFGIVPGSVRLSDGRTPKGYKREAFQDAWRRWLVLGEGEPVQPPQKRHAATNPENGREGPIPNRHTRDHVADPHPAETRADGGCGGVAHGGGLCDVCGEPWPV